MRKRTKLFLIFLFLFMLFFNLIVAKAMNTGFLTDKLSEDEKNVFISNIDFHLIESEPAKNAVECFDVNKNEMIAIGQKSQNRKIICVYSSDGNFQYGYAFDCYGSYGVEWDEENLNIYFIRSSMVISVAPNGEILDVLEVTNSIENNSYVNHFIYATERTIGDTTYLMRNDMGIINWIASSYSQIIIKDVSGAENIIYDVSSTQLLNTIISIIFVCVFIFVAIATIASQIIKSGRGNKKQN